MKLIVASKSPHSSPAFLVEMKQKEEEVKREWSSIIKLLTKTLLMMVTFYLRKKNF